MAILLEQGLTIFVYLSVSNLINNLWLFGIVLETLQILSNCLVSLASYFFPGAGTVRETSARTSKLETPGPTGTRDAHVGESRVAAKGRRFGGHHAECRRTGFPLQGCPRKWRPISANRAEASERSSGTVKCFRDEIRTYIRMSEVVFLELVRHF